MIEDEREELTMSNTVYDLTSEDFADFALDQMDENTRTPARFKLEAQEFDGMVLGFGSSYATSNTHTGHMPGTTPPQGVRCSACRWADVAILRAKVPNSDTTMYAVMLLGKSDIEGEATRVKPIWTEEAFEVLQHITVSGASQEGRGTVHTSARRIPMPNAIAFRYAAFVDAGIKTVLDEWDDAIPDYKEKAQGQRF
jgi:hypothetical protein